MLIDPLTLSHPNGDYFSTTLDQTKWRDDVFGNQFVLLKDSSNITTLYNKKNTLGEIWIKTPANKIYSISDLFLNTFNKYIGRTEYTSLSANSFKDFEIFYDTIILVTEIDNDEYIIVEKYNYNFDDDIIKSLNGKVISLSSENETNYWFDENKNKLILSNLSFVGNTVYPNIWTIDISPNIINLDIAYPINNEQTTLTAEQTLSGFDTSIYTNYNTILHTSNNKLFYVETLAKNSNTFDLFTFNYRLLDGASEIEMDWIRGLQPTISYTLSTVDWYNTSLSSDLTLSGTVGDEILVDLSKYPHDGYGTSEISYEWDDNTNSHKETQNTYFYNTQPLLVSDYYYNNDDPISRPIKHTYTKSGTYTIRISITNAGTLRRETLEKLILISKTNLYTNFNDIYLLDARENNKGITYALETKNPNYITFLNITKA